MKGVILLLDWIQRSRVLRWIGVDPIRLDGFRNREFLDHARPDEQSILFHVSSQGELEMVMPLIEDHLGQGDSVVVSVFSGSAVSGLKALRGRVTFCALSPAEKVWEEWFQAFGIKKVVLSRYDFWPGLLHAAQKRSCPVVVVNAADRRSLGVLRCLLGTKGAGRFLFLCPSDRDASKIAQRFPEARVIRTVDPRWERVSRRLEGARSDEPWAMRALKLVGPRVLVGSAWMEDLLRVVPAFHRFSGSLVVVPHSLEEGNLERMRRYLEQEVPGRYLLVNQMGVLVELYRTAHRAFVGGGYGRGIHSTLEPALNGIPVASGPRGVEQFSDATELRRLRILTVCQGSEEIVSWLRIDHPPVIDPDEVASRRRAYGVLLEECRGFR